MSPEDFVSDYADALRQRTAGLFVGAGVSRGAGYPDWRELVADMGREVGLDVSRTPDLAGLVQYFLNRSGKTRTRLSKIVAAAISPEKDIPATLRVLARLPVQTIWTTNYDTLIERAWREQRLRLDVKTDKLQIAQDTPDAHGVLYKMHGTISEPAKIVIAKGDYETYRRNRGEFLNLLHSHLVSKRLLFLGFSFTDPNLAYLFMMIREAFEENPPQHYAVVKTPHRVDFKGKGAAKEFEYALNAHKLWVDDLQNYGIQCVEVESYADIQKLLEAVEWRLASESVFVSGSYPTSRSEDQRRPIEDFSAALGRLIARRGCRLVSGFGETVGSATLSGCLESLYQDETPNLDRRLYLRPFPQMVPPGVRREDFFAKYREEMVRQSGACLFVGGYKQGGDGGLVVAEGVVAEYEISKQLNRLPIPVGAFGGAGAQIWDLVSLGFEATYPGLARKWFDALNDPKATTERLVEAVERILAWNGKRRVFDK